MQLIVLIILLLPADKYDANIIVTDEVELIEHNTFGIGSGTIQYVYWSYREVCLPHHIYDDIIHNKPRLVLVVREWKTFPDKAILIDDAAPPYYIHTGPKAQFDVRKNKFYITYFDDTINRTRIIYSNRYIETSSEDDPEVKNRSIVAKQERYPLSKK